MPSEEAVRGVGSGTEAHVVVGSQLSDASWRYLILRPCRRVIRGIIRDGKNSRRIPSSRAPQLAGSGSHGRLRAFTDRQRA